MKSKHLLLSLLLALLVPWAAMAQETLTVCDGTVTDEYIPIYGYWADGVQHGQMIYPASLLSDMSDGEISEITFHISSWGTGNGDPGNPWTVKVGITEATTFTAFDNTTELTQIFNGSMTYDDDHTTMSFTLDEPYTYEGGNLLFDFSTGSGSQYRHVFFYGVESTASAIYNYSSYSANVKNFLPKISFTYEPAAAGDCPKPKTLVISEVTARTATATWTLDEPLEPTANGFNIEYKKASDPDEPQYWYRMGTAYDVYSTTFTNLTPETEYQARVQSACGENVDSDWRYAQNFTTEVSCFPPTGYQIVEGSLTYNYVSFQWDYEEGEVFQYTMMHGHGLNPADANFNQGDWMAGESFPYWDNLFSDYDYTFFLRKKCDVDDFSAPVSIEFTTPEACPAPELATPTNPTTHGVTLSWTGSYDSY